MRNFVGGLLLFSAASLASANPLLGEWDTDCVTDSGFSYGMNLQFDNKGNATFVYESYDDTNCLNANTAYEMVLKYKPVVAAVKGVAIDIEIQSVGHTPLTNAMATALNASSYCGFTDWTAGVRKEITGVDCDGDVTNKGDKNYTRLFVDGTKLYWGDDENGAKDGSTPEKRPTKADMNSDAFEKVK